MLVAVLEGPLVLRHLVDASHLRSDILEKFNGCLVYFLDLAWLEDLVGPLVEVLHHLLDVRVQSPMNLVQFGLLRGAQLAFQLVKVVVDFVGKKLSSLIVGQLGDACLIL